MCVHIPFRLNPIASWAWLGKQLPCPLQHNEVLHLYRWYTYTHTLAQNSHCEFWCGMHLACKNTPITPDRNGSVKRPEKFEKLPSPWSVHGPLRCWRICASSLLGRKTLSNCQCTLPNSLSHDQWFHWRKFRSTISFCALVVDFRGHQLANLIGAMACDNLLENLGVKYPVILGKLRLQWVVLRLMPSRIHSWHWNTGCRCCVSICGHRIGAMRWGGSRKP